MTGIDQWRTLRLDHCWRLGEAMGLAVERLRLVEANLEAAGRAGRPRRCCRRCPWLGTPLTLHQVLQTQQTRQVSRGDLGDLGQGQALQVG